MPQDKLYYVHRIVAPADTKNDNKKYRLYLLLVSEENKYENNLMFWPLEYGINSSNDSDNAEMTVTHFQQRTGIYEGCFVVIEKNDTPKNANSYPLAKKNILEGNKYRNYLKAYKAEFRDDITGTVTDVCSYHINVGHGNTSIIAFKEDGICHLWMIDCAFREIKTWHNYRNNINACFEHIKNKYSLQEIKIDKLLITHLHYDHIGSVVQLMKGNYFADNLEIWFNDKFACSSQTYLDMVNAIDDYGQQQGKNYRIIEPIKVLYKYCIRRYLIQVRI